MGRRNRKGRAITGIVVLDKPTGQSSNHLLQRVKRLYDANKAGHTGSLDPLATGVLPICLGEATKISGYLLDADKQYRVTCRLGVVTDSGDSDGEVIAENLVPSYTQAELQTIIDSFIGTQQQVPPMYSALKHQGQPLYKLARQGIEIERKSREITIYAIELLNCDEHEFSLDVRCSKGTYIRTLVEDISHRLGCGGHVTMLRRTAVAGYDLNDAISLESLTELAETGDKTALDALLHKAEDALPEWPAVYFNEQDTQSLRYGQAVVTAEPFISANVRLFDHQQQFMGLGEMSPEGNIAPKRLFV
jgi:tRNA pseudouridine55 synthase